MRRGECNVMDAKPPWNTEPPASEDPYPARDGKPLGETATHVILLGTLIFTLRAYFKCRPDVYVIGGIFLYYREGDAEARTTPDVMVIKGVDAGWERCSWKTWEEGVVPCVIIELTSVETVNEDQRAKRRIYERLGVREYFLFDPLRECLDCPLLGYRLIGDRYDPLMPDSEGGVTSVELGMRLIPRGAKLALSHHGTGEGIPGPEQIYDWLEKGEPKATKDPSSSPP
jgi:Uma2 family endonuclease